MGGGEESADEPGPDADWESSSHAPSDPNAADEEGAATNPTKHPNGITEVPSAPTE
jgi:hypothetical protein